MWFDDDDEDDGEGTEPTDDDGEPGDYDLDDDMGTKIGAGHDPIEDEIT